MLHRAAAAAAPLALMDEEVDGGCEQPGPSGPPPAPSDPQPPAADIAMHDDADDDDEVDGTAAPLEAPIPENILGARCKYYPRDKGIRVWCPHHVGCACYRSARMDVDIFGLEAGRWFLETWLSKWDRPGLHKNYRPTRADIRQYLADKAGP